MKKEAESGYMTEFGFWVYAKASKDSGLIYSFSEIESGERTICHQVTKIAPRAPLKQDVGRIPFEGCYPIAYFHTHTSITDCKCPGHPKCGRDVGFTIEDKNWAEFNEMPLFVYDYIATENGQITSVDPINSRAEYESYRKMSKRPTPKSISEIEFKNR